jgi:O-antigen ligase
MTLSPSNAIWFPCVMTLLVMAGLVAVEPSLSIAVVAAPMVIAATIVAFGAIGGNRAATLILVFMAIFLIDIVFRVRDYQDKGVDFQVVLKLAAWGLIGLVAILNPRYWLGTILVPSNIPWIMFLIWLLFTATLSPIPAYSAVSAFSICAYAMFCAYIFARFDHVEIIAAMVASIVVFCAISIVIYFAIPEFGRYVYWLNEQRYVSGRLAGVAGSANNMGRIAAFGLLLVGLYAREFSSYSRLLTITAVLIMSVALVMTNSRTSMAMIAAILFAVYALNWRRLYIAIFGVSAALVCMALLLPAGDEALKLISRSGNLEEVTSMTGRTDIWYAVLKLAEEQPITGHGYASSILVLPQHEREVGFLTSHAHNLVLQLLLTTGWVGVVLFGISVVCVALRASIFGDRVVLALLSFVFLNGVTESSGFTTLANICSLAFAMAVTLPPIRYDNSNHAHHPAHNR